MLAFGCGREPVKQVADQRPTVLTTFTVLADLATNVAGERLQVRSIVKPGAEIHGYQPTPSDIEQAVGASLIVENGFGLELWARRFTAAAGDIPTLTLTEGMPPLLIGEDAYAGKPNPHAWMSPKRTMAYVDRLVQAFTRLDPVVRMCSLPTAVDTRSVSRRSTTSCAARWRGFLSSGVCW